MGPRLQERGVSEAKRQQRQRRRSFNGAALTRARSSITPAQTNEKIYGFNGAALTRARSYQLASLSLPAGLMLQWGRAYKSAEFQHDLKCNRLLAELQWGRAYKSAELARQARQAVVAEVASMGPRLQERGVEVSPSLQVKIAGGFNGAALTRARSFRELKTLTNFRGGLQWGRAYKSAELRLFNEIFVSFHGRFNGAALTRARS